MPGYIVRYELQCQVTLGRITNHWQSYLGIFLLFLFFIFYFSPSVGIFWILFNWMELSTIESMDNSFGMPYTRHVCDFCTHVPIVSFKKKKKFAGHDWDKGRTLIIVIIIIF